MCPLFLSDYDHHSVQFLLYNQETDLWFLLFFSELGTRHTQVSNLLRYPERSFLIRLTKSSLLCPPVCDPPLRLVSFLLLKIVVSVSLGALVCAFRC